MARSATIERRRITLHNCQGRLKRRGSILQKVNLDTAGGPVSTYRVYTLWYVHARIFILTKETAEEEERRSEKKGTERLKVCLPFLF